MIKPANKGTQKLRIATRDNDVIDIDQENSNGGAKIKNKQRGVRFGARESPLK